MKIPKVKDIVKYFREHPTTLALVDWSKHTSLPGFFGVPIYDILVFLYLETQRNALQVRANSVAFSFLLALFPATIVLLSLLPYLPIADFVNRMEMEMGAMLPYDVTESIMKFIRDITDTTRGGLLSASFVLSLFFASNGMMALLRGFDKRYEKTTFLSRNFFAQRLISIQLVLFLGTMLVSSIILVIVGNHLIAFLAEYLRIDSFTKGGIFAVRWMAVLFLFYGSIALIYRYGPAIRERFDFFSPGATLATLLCILTSRIFSLYVDSVNTFNQLYGSLGVLIVFMIWLRLNAFILLAGFELNAAIAVNRDIKKIDELDGEG